MTIRRMSGLEVCMYAIGDVASFPKDVNPNQKYMHTAWERIKGRVIVGVNEDQEALSQLKSAAKSRIPLLYLNYRRISMQ